MLHQEVKAKPFMLPSQLEILDRQALEDERIRQLLLADDFRERALMKMMDGVLEIRWEDTIKIDIHKPACIIEKQPEQYTSDDIKAVKKYEADVKVLRQERERYKRMLEADYAKISGLLQEGIDKFDAKLNDFYQVSFFFSPDDSDFSLLTHQRHKFISIEYITFIRIVSSFAL